MSKYKVKKELVLKNCIFKHYGSANFQNEYEILQKIKKQFNKFSNTPFQNKLYSIIIEFVINTYRSSIPNSSIRVLIGQTNKEVNILCESMIYWEQKQKLVNQISRLNDIHNNSLELNKKQNRNLSLVDVVKKTQKKLLYQFTEEQKNQIRFSIIVSL